MHTLALTYNQNAPMIIYIHIHMIDVLIIGTYVYLVCGIHQTLCIETMDRHDEWQNKKHNKRDQHCFYKKSDSC